MNTLRARLDKAGTSIQALADYLAMNYSTVQRAVKMNEPPKRRAEEFKEKSRSVFCFARPGRSKRLVKGGNQ